MRTAFAVSPQSTASTLLPLEPGRFHHLPSVRQVPSGRRFDSRRSSASSERGSRTAPARRRRFGGPRAGRNASTPGTGSSGTLGARASRCGARTRPDARAGTRYPARLRPRRRSPRARGWGPTTRGTTNARSHDGGRSSSHRPATASQRATRRAHPGVDRLGARRRCTPAARDPPATRAGARARRFAAPRRRPGAPGQPPRQACARLLRERRDAPVRHRGRPAR